MVIADSKNIPTSLYLQEKGHDYTIFAQIMIEMQISPPPPSSSIIFSQIFSSVDFSLRATHRNLGSIRDLGRPLTEIVRNPKPQLRTAEFPNPCLPHSQTCLHFAMGLTD